MKALLYILMLLISGMSYSQTVFSETFDESDGSTSGTDVNGTNWSVTYNYAGNTSDYIEVQSGQLECKDTNGPGEWETDDFDISACTDGMTISVDISESGDMENVDTPGCECNCGDAIKLEISYDGGSSWIAYSDAINGSTDTGVLMSDCGTCGSPSTAYPEPWCGMEFYGPLIGTGNFTSSTFSNCLSVGISNTMRIRMTFLTWSGDEYLYMDNISVVCSSCALPVELNSFNVQRKSDQVYLDWQTLSESNNKEFHIERSDDGMAFIKIGTVKGKIRSDATIDYEFIDEDPLNREVTYYRLVQQDLNGKMKYSAIKTVKYSPTNIFYADGKINVNISDDRPNQKYTVNLYNLSGKLVHTGSINQYDLIDWQESGFYILEIPEADIKQKIAIP